MVSSWYTPIFQSWLTCLFIYLFSWSCRSPEHNHIPQFDECGIEQYFGSNISYVIQRWYVHELEDIAVAKYLHPFLSDIDVFHPGFDDSVVTESLAPTISP